MTSGKQRLRVIDFGFESAVRSQAVYHGVAEAMLPDSDPVLTLVNPDDPYVCIGLHQDIDKEVDRGYCDTNCLPIVRRHVGGGAVYLDRNQMFFHFIYPVHRAPRFVAQIYESFIAPVVATYRALGVEATFRPVNDIHVNGRKIGGTGAASIGSATLMVGSFLFDFDINTMVKCLNLPSEKFRDKLRAGMTDYMTTLTKELGAPPERDLVKRVFLEQVEAHLAVDCFEDQLSAAETAAIDRQTALLVEEEWTEQPGRKLVANGVKIAAGTHLTEGMYKAPGGLIRTELLDKDGRIAGLTISGDFTVFPADGMQQVADALLDQPLEHTGLAALAEEEMRRLGIDIPGVSGSDVALAVLAAVHSD